MRADGAVEYMNRAWSTYTGLAQTEVSPEDWRRVTHPDDIEGNLEEHRRAREAHDRIAREFRLRRHDGVYRWFIARSEPVWDAEGKVYRRFGVATDIDDTKQIQAKLAEMTDSIPQIIWTSDADESNVAYNRKWWDYTGLDRARSSPADAIGCVHPEDIERIMPLWRPKDGKIADWEAEYRLRRHDGVYRWHLGRVVSARDENGAVKKRYGTATDIDETKRIFEEYRLLGETVPSFVWVTDVEGRMVYANSRWEEFTGIAAAKFGSGDWEKVIHPDDFPKTVAAWREAGAKGAPYEAEFRVRGKDGRYRWVLRRAAPVRHDDGNVIRWIGVSVDISDQKRLEQELRAAIEVRDQFLAVCSHELKTPLTLLELHAESFKRKYVRGNPADLTGEALQKYFDRLDNHLKRLDRRINDMLDISRISTGRLDVVLEEIDLVAQTRAALENLAPELENTAAALSLAEEGPVACAGDPHRIEQVIANLVENALKYGKGKPVEIRVHSDRTSAILEVRDRGPGIAPENQKRIFGRFERAADGTGVSGLGLGLFIASEIVAAHRGEISLTSRPGEGSVFTVRLPKIEPEG